MNTATPTAQYSTTRYTREERKIHEAYAKKCIRAKRFEDVSSRFMAMKMECELLGLRWCPSREFLNLARIVRVDSMHAVRRWAHAHSPASSEHYTFVTSRGSVLRDHARSFRVGG